jgi:hypothetical protein
MIAARQIAFGKAAGKKEEPPAYWGLCFTAEEAGSTIAMQAVGSAQAVTLETSYDGEIWEPFAVGETVITLPKVGDKVYFRAGEGGNTRINKAAINNYNHFALSGSIAASGDLTSLLNADNPMDIITQQFCFSCLFYDQSSLVSAPELNATKIGSHTYSHMLRGTSITVAPDLPATTMGTSCYMALFQNCSLLRRVPKILPATELPAYCYQSMFNGCAALKNAPELPAAILNTNNYAYMFNNCKRLDCIKTRITSFSTATSGWIVGVAPTGTFICPTKLGTNETIWRSVSACPEGWTVINED